jgi:hypothetical protein
MLELPIIGSPRVLSLVSNKLFCLTNEGVIYLMDGIDGVISSDHNNGWRVFHSDHRYVGYSVMSSSSDSLNVLCVGSLHGNVKILSLFDSVGTFEWTCYQGKVYSLIWMRLPDGLLPPADPQVSQELLVTTGPEGAMICWLICVDDISGIITANPVTHMRLPLSKHRWCTCAISLKQSHNDHFIIICGDRKGSIHVYSSSIGHHSDYLSPVQSFIGKHGPNGVTHLTQWMGVVYSAGRDGYCRSYSMVNDSLVEMNRFHPIRGVDWIDNITFTTGMGLLTTAFHGVSERDHR